MRFRPFLIAVMQQFIDRFSRGLGSAERAFRLGKLGASILTAGLVCGASLAIVNAEMLLEPRLDGQRLSTGVLIAAFILLALGSALRILRGARLERVRGLGSGVLQGVSREVEIATGFVASVLAGIAVAGNETAANAIGGWFATATGLSSSATVTIAFIAAIGTVLTDLARGGIARAVRESAR